MKHEVKLEKISNLKKHPRNYREHPQDQLDHLCKSINEHGIYRPVVLANDGTILAGHGVVQACKQLEIKEIPVIKMEIGSDEPKALKLLTADNEISHLAEINDRQLSEILKEIKEDDVEGLDGTGYDEMMLANLVMVTRPAEEIADIDQAKEWVGMPTFWEDEGEKPEVWKYEVKFDSETELESFVSLFNVPVKLKRGKVWSTKYPDGDYEDPSSVRFE
jgi:hypothetical protein